MAFTLQHGAAVCRLQGKVLLLLLRMVLVVAYAVVNPGAHALHGQQLQDMGGLLKEADQAGAGVGLVDAVDESIKDIKLPFHKLCCLSSVSDISTKSSIKSSISSKDSGELERRIDYNPNWRDTVVDTVVTTACVVNTNAGQYQMQQQQQIVYVPRQDYHPHPGAAPHPINGHFPPLSRLMSQITEDLLRSCGRMKKKTNSSHEYYQNSVDNVDEWQCPINAPNIAVPEGEQQHHHSRVSVSGEPYSIVVKINTNLSQNTMDTSVDWYMPEWTVE